MSTLDHKLKLEMTAVRRLEVITGTGRRRRFSEDHKSGIIEETLAPGAVVSEVGVVSVAAASGDNQALPGQSFNSPCEIVS